MGDELLRADMEALAAEWTRFAAEHKHEREDHQQAGHVTADEAQEILSRFIASHFHNHDYGPGAEKARFTIPADPKRDDDIRLSAFIAQARKALAVAEAAREYREAETRVAYDQRSEPKHEARMCARRVLDAALADLDRARKGDADGG